MPSSINHKPTFHYSQPEEYRFSHDSVFLAQQVFKVVKSEITPEWRILDLCAGCGIVGMDFLFHCRRELGFEPKHCDFVEIQEEYVPHFFKNAESLNSTAEIQFLKQCYSTLINGERRYDLVLCNPPYFRVENGKLPSSAFKQRCRFFIDSDFATLLRSMAAVLQPRGMAYLLLRNSSDHGADVLGEAQSALSEFAQIEIVGEIRGTPLAKITLI